MRELAVGENVSIRDLAISGHRRTPKYVLGKLGTVERLCGYFRNPEELAYGLNGLPKLRLYRVRFSQQVLWPDYAGLPQDTLELEIFEHWLEPTQAGTEIKTRPNE